MGYVDECRKENHALRIIVNGELLGLDVMGHCPICQRDQVPLFISQTHTQCARCYVGSP